MIRNEYLKSGLQSILKDILFVICLSVLVLRTTVTEGMNLQLGGKSLDFSTMIFSQSISLVLVLIFTAWFISALWQKIFVYRFTGIEIPVLFFLVAAVVSTIFASDKRAAINQTSIFVSIMLTMIVLTQLLDSPVKIKIVLMALIASAIVNCFEIMNQFLVTNDMMIDQYEKSPQDMLQALKIIPGTLNHMLFEHRLYSKDIKGFFTTSNSAGSFLILSLFSAAVLLHIVYRRIKLDKYSRNILTAVTVIIAVSFFVTGSRGAMVSFVAAAVLLAGYFFFGAKVARHKKLCILVVLVVITAVCGTVVLYGMAKGTLPGGNAMMVRWQYWTSAAQMCMDNFKTGIGPGNFSTAYLHYKPASAIESVSDPHNFVLSIMSQFGPLGLAAFLCIIFIPLLKVIFKADAGFADLQQAGDRKKLTGILIAAVCLTMLVVRPFGVPVTLSQSGIDNIIAVLTLYAGPASAFFISFMLLNSALSVVKFESAELKVIAVFLFCAVCGVLIHNLIDFALFEPSVFSFFSCVLACLLVLSSGKIVSIHISRPARWLATVICINMVICAFGFTFLPSLQSCLKIQRAVKLSQKSQFDEAAKILYETQYDDKFGSSGPAMNAGLFMQRFNLAGKKIQFLKNSQQCLFTAIKRDPTDYRNYENLSRLYSSLAFYEPDKRDFWLGEALEAAESARERYPGLGRFYFNIGYLNELLGDRQAALENYRKAIEIEDSFQSQFAVMYPGRETISRIDPRKYLMAKQKVSLLSNQQQQ